MLISLFLFGRFVIFVMRFTINIIEFEKIQLKMKKKSVSLVLVVEVFTSIYSRYNI